MLSAVLAEETGLQRFAPADDDGRVDVDGHQWALARLEQVAKDARDYAAHAKAPNTLKAYRNDWADFSQWCALHRLEFLPAAPNNGGVVPQRSGDHAHGFDPVSPPQRHLAGPPGRRLSHADEGRPGGTAGLSGHPTD